jgi:hypothetical protein
MHFASTNANRAVFCSVVPQQFGIAKLCITSLWDVYTKQSSAPANALPALLVVLTCKQQYHTLQQR